MLCLILYCCLALDSVNYTAVFGADYQKALQFVSKHKNLFDSKALHYHLPEAELKAIVFPELIRYSTFKDYLETKALEYTYTNQGVAVVDFSIGHFQMKPSFVERLESVVRQDSQWQLIFAPLIQYSDTSIQNIRTERIRRLKELNWQLDYLCCFYKIAHKKYAKELLNASPSDRVRCIAAAYNIGLKNSYRQLMQQSTVACFPYGANYPSNNQYCYTNISCYFYRTKSGL